MDDGEALVDADTALRGALMERAARSLPLNSSAEVTHMHSVILRVVDNVLAHPDDLKYRTLKLANKTLRTKLFDRSGSYEIMALLGFKRELNAAGESVLTLPVGSTDIDVLTATRAWLDEQITTALEGGKGSTCAECVIQVRLPNSRVVRGSFYPGETLQAVRTFVEHSSLMIRGSVGHSDDDGGCGGGGGWVLQQTAPVKTFTEQETSQTLDSLGLTPRAVLVARILEGGAGRSGGAGAGTAGVFGGGTGGGADSAMDEARAEHQQKMQQRQAALRLQKQQLAAEREAERTQALREFESDREEQRERRKMRMGGVGGDSRAVDGDQQGGGQGNGDASGGADDGGEQEGLVESEGR